MSNKQVTAFLRLFGEEGEGEIIEMPVDTPQANCSGEAERSTPAAGESRDPEERSKAFRALMEGEYKDLFTAYFQETFNRRFREQKEIKEELEASRGVIRAAAEYFGVKKEELLATIRAEDGKRHASTASVAEQCPPVGDRPTEQAVQEAVERARLETEQRLIAAIRARGLRPAENALHGGVGAAMQGEVSRLSRQQRAALAKRAAEGERILL
jgi:hypothetical protein